MGNNQQTPTDKQNASNKASKSQKPTPPSTKTDPQVTASAASSDAADGRLTKSSRQTSSDSLKPLRGPVPPTTLQNRLDKGHLPPIDAASSSTETPVPQDSQKKQKLEDFEQMYDIIMLKLSKMDSANGSTKVCLSYTL